MKVMAKDLKTGDKINVEYGRMIIEKIDTLYLKNGKKVLWIFGAHTQNNYPHFKSKMAVQKNMETKINKV